MAGAARPVHNIAARRSRAMAWPPSVAARASSTFANEGALQRLGALEGITLAGACNRGTFACRPTGGDGGDDSSDDESKYSLYAASIAARPRKIGIGGTPPRRRGGHETKPTERGEDVEKDTWRAATCP